MVSEIIEEEKIPIVGRVETTYHGYRLRIDIAKNPLGIEVIYYLMVGNKVVSKKKTFIEIPFVIT